MKLVKYYCWERFFEDKINEIRKREEKLMFKMAVIKVINVAIVFAVPPTTAYVIFIFYEFSFKRLIASVAFTTLSLFNILRFPLVVLPKALRAASEGYTAIKRIQSFLMQPVEIRQKASAAPGIRMVRIAARLLPCDATPSLSRHAVPVLCSSCVPET
jgi:ATP-binding cassette, subfamily C (CFTR/MRP), member 1